MTLRVCHSLYGLTDRPVSQNSGRLWVNRDSPWSARPPRVPSAPSVRTYDRSGLALLSRHSPLGSSSTTRTNCRKTGSRGMTARERC